LPSFRNFAMPGGAHNGVNRRRSTISEDLESRRSPASQRQGQDHEAAASTEDPDESKGERLIDALDQVQKGSTFFRGFEGPEIQMLSTYVSHVEFDDGELIAASGEHASWCGILLSGRIDAVSSSGDVLGSLTKGHIVGEMALFRGGTRMCDMRSNGQGSLAAILFSDIEKMYHANAPTAQKLLVKFGQAASAKLVFPHPPPSTSSPKRSNKEKGGGKGDVGDVRDSVVPTHAALRHQVAQDALVGRGLDHIEASELLKCLSITSFGEGQVLMKRGNALSFVGLVLEGTVRDGGEERGVGELIGEWWSLSGCTDALAMEPLPRFPRPAPHASLRPHMRRPFSTSNQPPRPCTACAHRSSAPPQ
jgi:hypothetical protein